MNLLLAAVLLVQAPSPEDLFKKVIEPIEKAKTIRVKSTWKVGNPAVGDTMEGSVILFMKEGNKIHQTAKQTHQGNEIQWTTICDGLKVWASPTGQIKDAPLLPNGSQKAIATLGFTQTNFLLMRFAMAQDPKERSPDLGKMLEVGEVKAGQEDAGASTLSYDVSIKSPNQADAYLDLCKCKIWYEPKTMRLVKRAVTSNDRSVPNTETYDEFTLNADIPDEKFKLPEVKK